jgi:hypothetical protein
LNERVATPAAAVREEHDRQLVLVFREARELRVDKLRRTAAGQQPPQRERGERRTRGEQRHQRENGPQAPRLGLRRHRAP